MSAYQKTALRLLLIELPVLIILVFALAPFVWLLLTSVKPNADLSIFPVRYWPSEFTSAHFNFFYNQI